MKELIKENTVLKTRNLNLCVSCEICLLICPKKAISMKNSLGQFLPVIDRNKCILCEKCLDLCPGLDIYPKKLRLSKSIKDTLIGNYLGCCIAESKNPLIRKRSTSGGLITNLVVKLIEDKVYDATFILNFEKFEEKPVRLKPTNNVNEIINAAKSKYIPVSLYEIIKILRRKEQKRYIIIATPCLIYGIKKFVEEFNIPSDNLLFLGLFCSNTLNFNILKFYKDKYAKKNEKIEKFIFRTKERFGWPGHTKIIFDSGRSIILHRKIRMGLVKFFSLNRCLYCFDKLNFFSDISFGDCYIKNKTSIKGKSSIIVRTEKGKKIFDKYSYLFNWEKISIDDIFNSQKIEKKSNNLAYAKIIIIKNTIYTEFEGETDFNSILEKNLKKLEKYIRLGANYNNFKIQLKQWVERGIDKIKRIFKKIHPVKESSRLKVIRYGLILKNYEITQDKEELRQELNIPKDKFILLSVGRHIPRKNFDLVIRAIHHIKQQKPDIKILYYLIGRGPETPHLRELTKELTLEDEVQFLGFVDKNTRNKYYKLSDVFIMPSTIKKESIEGFGIVFLEANYYKIPVIGTLSGGIVEAIIDGKTGFLIKPNDINELIEKILYFYENPEKRKKIGKQGYKRVIDEFNWNKLIFGYISHFQNLLKEI